MHPMITCPSYRMTGRRKRYPCLYMQMWSEFLHEGGPTRFGTVKFDIFFSCLQKGSIPSATSAKMTARAERVNQIVIFLVEEDDSRGRVGAYKCTCMHGK
jgi:hypothetical protein